MYFICGHISRSEVVQFSLMVERRKLDLSVGILSCAQNVHFHTVPSRVAVSSEALSHRERILRAGRTSSSVCRRNRNSSLSICSKTKVVIIPVRWSCLAPMSLICVLQVHLLFSWALKLDDIPRCRANPRDLGRLVSTRPFARIALKSNFEKFHQGNKVKST